MLLLYLGPGILPMNDLGSDLEETTLPPVSVSNSLISLHCSTIISLYLGNEFLSD